jgi:hypothetical protein
MKEISTATIKKEGMSLHIETNYYHTTKKKDSCIWVYNQQNEVMGCVYLSEIKEKIKKGGVKQ